jgi:hypothetical protein
LGPKRPSPSRIISYSRVAPGTALGGRKKPDAIQAPASSSAQAGRCTIAAAALSTSLVERLLDAAGLDIDRRSRGTWRIRGVTSERLRNPQQPQRLGSEEYGT